MKIAKLLAVLLLVSTAPVWAQATRTFQMGFTAFPPSYDDIGYYRAFTFLSQHADLVSQPMDYGVPWNEALKSSDPTTYPQGLQVMWAYMLAREQMFIPNMNRYVQIQPINYLYAEIADYWNDSTNQPLPAPWNSYTFNSPQVEAAFLNYAIAVINYFNPKYLAIGIESNILLARHPEQWVAYKQFNQFLYSALKALYPNLMVFPTIQYEHMLGYQAESAYLATLLQNTYPNVLTSEVADLMRFSDAFCISTYPYMTAGITLTASYYDVAHIMAAALNLAVAVDQTGYTSQNISPQGTLLYGSPDVQNVFVAFLLSQAYFNHYRFIINYIPIDYGTNYGTSAVSQTWAYTGLAATDGTAKPALSTWEAFRALTYLPD